MVTLPKENDKNVTITKNSDKGETSKASTNTTSNETANSTSKDD